MPSEINMVRLLSLRFIRFGETPQIFPFRRKLRRCFTMEHKSRNYSILLENRDYETAVAALNSLQSNAAVLERARAQKDRWSQLNIPQTQKYLGRIGVSLDDLDNKFQTIHVSGTKGKGSTCAFSESILRCHGLKTGFYSSPHLVEVRERLRINGKPLSKDLFAKYFWHVYSTLSHHKENEEDMPAYFRFLTVMAFYVFIQEKVDVAVIEVGIGGLYDCTNVIRKPAAVGISSLGLDHVSLLGDTVEKIAVHKAGIMKPGVPAFTVSDQPGHSMQVLASKASEIQCTLYTVPSLDAYQWGPYSMKLGLSGEVQLKNASLALQLSHALLQNLQQNTNGRNLPLAAVPFQISSADALGLALTTWPGRSQVIHDQQLSFYVDGAHTPESIEACVQWFQSRSSRRRRALIFNTTGDRNTSRLLQPLQPCNFDLVIFCPNIVAATDSTPKDLLNLMVTREQQLARCQSNKNDWIANLYPDSLQDQTVLSVTSINDALERVKLFSAENNFQVDVLVTGSLHLVGGVLSLLDPELKCLNPRKEAEHTVFRCFNIRADATAPASAMTPVVP